MTHLRQTPLTCSGHTRPVVHLAFSDITDSSYFLISASKDGKPMLRQGDTGDWIGTFEGHKGAVWGVAINKYATKAASGAADFHAKIWDALSGEELLSIPHNHIVKSVHFSTDSTYLATGSNEKLLRIWDLNKPESAITKFAGHTGGIKHVYFYRNDTRLISCSDDKTVRIWDSNSGQEIKKLEFNNVPNSVEVSPDNMVLTVASGSTVSFWDSEGLSKLNEYKVPTIVNSASLLPEKSIFVCGGDDLKMYKFDYKTGLELESFKGHFGPVHCVRFSPTENYTPLAVKMELSACGKRLLERRMAFGSALKDPFQSKTTFNRPLFKKLLPTENSKPRHKLRKYDTGGTQVLMTSLSVS